VAVVEGVLFREGNISAQFLYRQEGKLSKMFLKTRKIIRL
jgi:hypothetical protein